MKQLLITLGTFYCLYYVGREILQELDAYRAEIEEINQEVEEYFNALHQDRIKEEIGE